MARGVYFTWKSAFYLVSFLCFALAINKYHMKIAEILACKWNLYTIVVFDYFHQLHMQAQIVKDYYTTVFCC